MFTKGEKVFSEEGKYLISKDKRKYGFVLKGTIDEFDEFDINNPLDIKISGNLILFQNNKLACLPETMDYVGIKTKLIKMKYSNDDQIALILNKDNSEEDLELYNKMQDWREWASYFATEVVKILNKETDS